MGFALTSLALLILTILIAVYREFGIVGGVLPDGHDKYAHMMEAIAGYGLGGSTVALFARVGGGIYTKAADVELTWWARWNTTCLKTPLRTLLPSPTTWETMWEILLVWVLICSVLSLNLPAQPS